MSTIKKIPLRLLERLKYVDDGYDWEERLSEKEEEQLYNAVLELWHVGKVAPKEFPCLRGIDCGMF